MAIFHRFVLFKSHLLSCNFLSIKLADYREMRIYRSNKSYLFSWGKKCGLGGLHDNDAISKNACHQFLIKIRKSLNIYNQMLNTNFFFKMCLDFEDGCLHLVRKLEFAQNYSLIRMSESFKIVRNPRWRC